MAIISISLNDTLLREMDSLQQAFGFSGRSEIIRAGLRKLISDEKDLDRLSGKVEGVLLVINQEKYNDDISKIRHEFTSIIRTQIHNHLENHKCLQIFVIKGNAAHIKNLVREFSTCRKTDFVKLFVS